VTVGRKVEENVLALNDGGVSSKHCEVRPIQGGYELVDLGSKNGTFVNDKRVKEKTLVNGDLIAFGNTRIYVGML
jgi:pSer/pThr/pTyr-binding forkhead associated (FHA) protein